MGDQIIPAVVSILTAVIGLAIITSLVSNNANTTGVISSASSGFNTILETALSPVTGSSGMGGTSSINGLYGH